MSRTLEPRDLAGLAPHLVDFTEMLFFFCDHFACVFFDEHRTGTHDGPISAILFVELSLL